MPEAPVEDVKIAYTPMHGVGGDIFLKTLKSRGFKNIAIVENQFLPDPDFPTVEFPNPEEPNAMNLLIRKANKQTRI